MRRLIVIVAVAGACLALSAQPVLAQKDPFDPVIDPNAPTTTTGTTTTGTTTTGTTTTTSTDVTPPFDSGPLSNTGTDLGPWMVVAYGLLVLGGTAVVLARMHGPKPIRR